MPAGWQRLPGFKGDDFMGKSEALGHSLVAPVWPDLARV
ncbi:hypothetical protein SAMN05414137_110100 [Streptacidiphilus jiangxiensis]|uniref:Uncharacterized protein n=1 Tax=Streptacidiphilus jiangxiensis TaxID=235985 RepID=A0A1H7RF39_STRJI|nr:hypothetical protein SAMN05414137_110100 [Streptacidiphilus jiangxiensis]